MPVGPESEATATLHAQTGSQPVATEDERLGAVLSGWRLDALLGRGRTARVYAAARQSGERAAVKVMNREFRGDDRVRRRIFREANFARREFQPAITRAYASDVTPTGEPYVVMERLYGRDLGYLARATGGLAPASALVILERALEIVAACHERNLIHRNLAPFNLFITTEGELRIYDLGSALVAGDAQDQELPALATDLHGYLAPELLASARAVGDERADIWSLGATLLTIATGQFISDSRSAAAWLQEEPPPLEPGSIRYEAMPVTVAALAPDIDPELAALIERATARDPEHRFASARDMLLTTRKLLEKLDPGATISDATRTDRLRRIVRPHLDAGTEAEAHVSGAWRSSEALRELFRLIENVLYAARRHSWEHAETTVRVEHLAERILAAVADDPDGVFWNVRPHSFEYRGETLWQPEPPNDQVPYNLFTAGFRTMHLLPGLSTHECREFLRWITLDPETDLATEDDLATRFWQLRFNHVRGDLVSAVVLPDVSDYERLDSELASMRADTVTSLRETVTRRLGDGSAEPALELERGVELALSRESLVIFDPELRNLLGVAADSALPRWRARLAVLLGRLLGEVHDPGSRRSLVEAWDQFVADAFQNSAHGDALDVFGSFAERSADAQLLDRLIEPLTREGRFALLIGTFIPSDARVHYGEQLPFLVDRLARLLDHTPPEHLVAVLDASGRTTDRELLGTLLRFVERHTDGNEQAIAAAIPSANAVLGTSLLDLLARRMNSESIQAIEAGLKNTNPKVQAYAVELLARYAPQRALRPLRSLLRHEHAPIRYRAMEAIARNRLVDGAAELLDWLGEPRFHALPPAEKRAAMGAALEADPENAESALASLVRHHGVIANPALDGSRIIAVELLRDRALGDDALEAIETAARKRWWNTPDLQRTAAEAELVVRARIEELDRSRSGDPDTGGD